MHSSKRRGGFKRGGPRIAMQLIRRIAPPVGGGWNGVAAALIAVALVALSVVTALAPSTAQALADIPASFNQNVTVTRRDIGASNRSPISNSALIRRHMGRLRRAVPRHPHNSWRCLRSRACCEPVHLRRHPRLRPRRIRPVGHGLLELRSARDGLRRRLRAHLSTRPGDIRLFRAKRPARRRMGGDQAPPHGRLRGG